MAGKARIVVVDDDERVLRLLVRLLTREGYQVRQAKTGAEMRALFETAPADLVILDIMLPDADGLSLARELRSHGNSNLGIIMLSGKGETVDKIVGLEVGADDYITKPFDQRELLARVRTILRRTIQSESRDDSLPSAIRFRGFTMNLEAHELVSPDGEQIYLTTNQFRLLSSLLRCPNRVLTREEILGLIAGRNWIPMDRSIDVLIGKVRRKIERDPKSPEMIKTIRGIGYKFSGPVEYL